MAELAGASRLTRLHVPLTDKSRFAVVSGTIVPSLYAFSCWLIESARRNGITRLYFISRDGYVPMKVTQRLVSSLAIPLECRYLYGSRQAWHLAGLHRWDDEVREWLLEPMDGETFGSVLKRLNLTWEEWSSDLASDEKWPKAGASVTLKLRERIWKHLSHPSNSRSGETVLRKASSCRTLLIKYFEQEKVIAGDNVGMVDLGWLGRTRTSIENAIGTTKSTRIHWFYFGLRPQARGLSNRLSGFLFDKAMPYSEIGYLAIIAESFCLAPHASVMHYKVGCEGVIEAVFKDKMEQHLDTWGRGDVLACLDSVLNHISPKFEHLADISKLRRAARRILQDFCERPTSEEAILWGDFPFEHDQAGHQVKLIGAPAKWTFSGALNGVIFGDIERSACGNISIAWGAGCWKSRRRSAIILIPFVIIGMVRVHGLRFTMKNALTYVVQCISDKPWFRFLIRDLCRNHSKR